MLIQLIIMCHWIGCMWHFLLEMEIKFQNEQNTWLHDMDLIDKDIYTRYMESFYWSVAVIMLIGTKGITFIETLFTTCILLVTVGVFAYLISTISMLIEELNKESQQYKRDLECINRFMITKNLGPESSSKIRGFMEYLYLDSNERNQTIQANSVLEKFPLQFRDEIYYEVNSQVLRHFSLIQNNFSKKTQERIIHFMEEKSFITNEKIFQQNQSNDLSIYLITKGQIELYYNRDDKRSFKICTLKEGDFIGDFNFITGLSYEYSAKTINFTTTQKIKRSDFMDILTENKEDFEKFMMIKQQISIDNYSKYYQMKCQICFREYHREINCNYLNYNPSIANTFLKGVHSKEQVRQKFFRRQVSQKDKFCALLQLDTFFDIQDRLFEQDEFLMYYECFIDLNEYSDEEQNSNMDSVQEDSEEDNTSLTTSQESSSSEQSLKQSMSQFTSKIDQQSNLKLKVDSNVQTFESEQNQITSPKKQGIIKNYNSNSNQIASYLNKSQDSLLNNNSNFNIVNQQITNTPKNKKNSANSINFQQQISLMNAQRNSKQYPSYQDFQGQFINQSQDSQIIAENFQNLYPQVIGQNDSYIIQNKKRSVSQNINNVSTGGSLIKKGKSKNKFNKQKTNKSVKTKKNYVGSPKSMNYLPNGNYQQRSSIKSQQRNKKKNNHMTLVQNYLRKSINSQFSQYQGISQYDQISTSYTQKQLNNQTTQKIKDANILKLNKTQQQEILKRIPGENTQNKIMQFQKMQTSVKLKQSSQEKSSTNLNGNSNSNSKGTSSKKTVIFHRDTQNRDDTFHLSQIPERKSLNYFNEAQYMIEQFIDNNEYESLFFNFDKQLNWKYFFTQFNINNLVYRYKIVQRKNQFYKGLKQKSEIQKQEQLSQKMN